MRYFNLFVYGTLMTNFRNHTFIPKCAKKTLGFITGNLYHYACGNYPMVQIPKTQDQIMGSFDYLNDYHKQVENKKDSLPFNLEFGRVYGELYRIPLLNNTEKSLRDIDRIERFNPNINNQLYNRTLVPVQTSDGVVMAWVYSIDQLPKEVVRILNGDWQSCFNISITKAVDKNKRFCWIKTKHKPELEQALDEIDREMDEEYDEEDEEES
jgi:gamma-glutamylcyclotransferase (GGCT)/AIG2-like uncharacterized protein YtfP